MIRNVQEAEEALLSHPKQLYHPPCAAHQQAVGTTKHGRACRGSPCPAVSVLNI
eukprot:COSAG01_NODE_14854_length_1403_cov_1.119632_1_plen_53_part_10